MGGLCPVLQYTSDHRKVGSIKDGLHGQPQIALWLTNQRMIRRIRHVCGWRMCSRKEHGAHKLDLARRVVSNVVSLQFRKGLTAMAGNAGSIAHSRAECSLGAQRMVCRRAAAHRGSPVICRATVKDAGSASKAHEAEKRKLTGTFDILAEDLQYIQQATGLDLTTSFSSVKEAHEQVRRYRQLQGVDVMPNMLSLTVLDLILSTAEPTVAVRTGGFIAEPDHR